jgi:hypothetical protein
MVKVIDPEPIKVSKKLYNVIRSFVESAVSDKYPHNVGVHYRYDYDLFRGDIVVFEKIKGNERKWRLIVSGNTVELRSGVVSVELRVESDKTLLKIQDYGYISTIEIPESDQLKLIELLKGKVIVPEDYVPYFIPVTLESLLYKLTLYYNKAVEHVESECKYVEKVVERSE